MKKQLLFCIVSSSLLVSACDKKSTEGAVESTPTSTAPAAPEAIPFGEDGHLSLENAQAVGHRWTEAVNDRDTSALNAIFQPSTTIVTHNGAFIDRVTPDVWNSQLSSKSNARLNIKPLEEFTHTKLPSGAVLRTNAFVKGEATGEHSSVWDLLVRDVDGEAKILGVFERLQRTNSNGAPDRYLGSSIVADGVVLDAQPDQIHERGYRTLIDPAGLAELWVDESKLPLEWQRFKGKKFVVTDANGETCETEVQGFRYYTRATVPDWVSEGWATQTTSKQGTRAAGEAAWTMTANRAHALVAKLSPDPRETCPNPVFARMAGAPAFPIYREDQNTPISDDEIFNRAKESEFAQKLEEIAGGRGASDLVFEGNRIEVRQFRDGVRHFVSLTVVPPKTCNAIAAATFFLWEFKQGNWALLNDPSTSRLPFVPKFVADVNNDGSPEFFGDGMVVRESGGSFRVVEDLRPVDFTTGC